MRAYVALLSLAAVASSAMGCGATVEVPRICLTEQQVSVPGSPAGGSVTSPRFSVDLTNQIPLLRTNTSDTDLRIDEVTITPVAGNPDLSGIQSATVQAHPASGPAVEMARYQRDPAAPAPAAILLGGDAVNVAPYLVAGQANLTFTLSGQPPRASWTADVKSCLHGQTSVSP
jgi:hypothetical protein